MMRNHPNLPGISRRFWVLLLLVAAIWSLAVPAFAQDGEPPETGGIVQELTGSAGPGAYVAYALNGLGQGALYPRNGNVG